MKRLIWFPTGRQMWLDLAVRLAEQGVATPVVWLGDDRLMEAAARRFPTARVLSLRTLARGRRTPPAHPRTAAAGRLWAEPSWPMARAHALKLMDRDDKDGQMSALEREAWLHQLVNWSAALIEETGAEALVMAESPHATPMYVLYAVAQAMGLPVLSFFSWPLLPGLGLRHGLNGTPISLPVNAVGDPAAREVFLSRGRDEIERYLARFEGAGYEFVPRYMQIQANVATGGRDLKSNPALRKIAGWVQLAVPRRMRASLRRRRLNAALAAVTSAPPEGRYVYFPLHYEPERTTTPDGGAFSDQFRTIALLRHLLPAEVSIVVKEHPSTFNAFMQGDLGRHPRHYAALAGLKGVYLLSHRHSSADLLRNCEGVATITGTVALEAAALGKPSVIFGYPWFSGCPNTKLYCAAFNWDDLIASPRQSRTTLRDWLERQLAAHVLPGTVNPSNERYFANWYDDGAFRRAELDALSATLAEVLSR